MYSQGNPKFFSIKNGCSFHTSVKCNGWWQIFHVPLFILKNIITICSPFSLVYSLFLCRTVSNVNSVVYVWYKMFTYLLNRCRNWIANLTETRLLRIQTDKIVSSTGSNLIDKVDYFHMSYSFEISRKQLVLYPVDVCSRLLSASILLDVSLTVDKRTAA